MQGVPEQFNDERDSARFRHLAQLPGLELYHAHISDYAFEPHTHEAFGIGTIETGAERFRYRGSQHLAAEKSVVTMNPDEIHTGESATEGGWRYRMVYIEPDLLEEVTGLRHWWFSDVTRHDPLHSQQIGRLIYGLWHTDDPLAQKEVITKEDLFGLPLILPERIGVQSELANWFGKDLAKLRVAFTSNLGTNAGVMAMHGLGYPVSIEGAAKYWGKSRLIQKHLYPEIKSGVIMAWRRNIPYSQAVQKMIEKMQEFEASEMSKRRRS